MSICAVWWILFGGDQCPRRQSALIDMVAEPEMAAFILDKFTDFYVAYFDRMLSAASGRINILRIADDLGMQDRLLISPAIFAQYLLPHESPDEVRRTAREMIRVLGKGGGYIISPSHVLQTDVPTSNILALYDEVQS